MILGQIGEKNVVWFKNSNNYGLFDPLMAHLVSGILKDVPEDTLLRDILTNGQVSQRTAGMILSQTREKVKLWNATFEGVTGMDVAHEYLENFYRSVHYQFHKTVCCVNYGNQRLFEEIHGKFAHLRIVPSKSHHTISTFVMKDRIYLQMDDTFCKAYTWENFHYLQGKLSMLVTMIGHQIPEKDWMGVFHASAISDGNRSLMILGDSGSGKSTALALLHHLGFDCIADDFVPMDSSTKHLFPFGAGISIKKKGVPALRDLYRAFDHGPTFGTCCGKTVSYIPIYPDFEKSYPCNKLLFLAYRELDTFQFERVSKVDAFQQLVPDSWLSGRPGHAAEFIDWFNATESYSLVYNDTQQLFSTVKKILNDEL
jgi:hypothetical protein